MHTERFGSFPQSLIPDLFISYRTSEGAVASIQRISDLLGDPRYDHLVLSDRRIEDIPHSAQNLLFVLRLFADETQVFGFPRLRTNRFVDLRLGVPGMHNEVMRLAMELERHYGQFDTEQVLQQFRFTFGYAKLDQEKPIGLLAFYIDPNGSDKHFMSIAHKSGSHILNMRLAIIGASIHMNSFVKEILIN